MMPDEDSEMKEIFSSLIKRNSLNWYNFFVIEAGRLRLNNLKYISSYMQDHIKVSSFDNLIPNKNKVINDAFKKHCY